MTHAEAFQLFREAVFRIWGRSAFTERLSLELVLEEPRDALASLAYNSPVSAIRDQLLRRASHYRLRVSTRLLARPVADVEKIMIHEAVHIGYGQHDAGFRALVRQHKGAVSESALDVGENKVRVQLKSGARYRTVKEFESEDEAEAWARQEARRAPGRYRLAM